jgi:hypothetical protein
LIGHTPDDDFSCLCVHARSIASPVSDGEAVL